MKYAPIDANYAILTKGVKLQHEKKPVSNLLSMQSVGFEQTFMKFIKIFIPQEFLYRKKTWKLSQWLSLIILMCDVLTCI